jgi:spore coat polysaccharide biosynthesis predicted glycosyltransferase SpsG
MCNKRKNIAFFTEGGLGIGNGHINRSTAVADGFRELGFRPSFYINGGNNCMTLRRPFKYQQLDWYNINYLDGLLAQYQIIVIDSYKAEAELLNYITSNHSNVLFIIDSTLNYDVGGSILFPSIYAQKTKYRQIPICEECIKLMGRKYILFTKEFWEKEPITINKNIQNVGVSLGSSSAHEIISRINLIKSILGGNITFYLFGKAEFELTQEFDSESLHVMGFVNKPSYIYNLKKMDLLICNGGQSLNEAILLGIPTISLITADNQEENIRTWESFGITYSVDSRIDFDKSKFTKYLKTLKSYELRNDIRGKAMKYLNPKGAFRAAKKIIEHYKMVR